MRRWWRPWSGWRSSVFAGAKDRDALDWLIAGLGNPGPRYAGTRHNVGRDTARLIAEREGARLDSSKFDTLFTRVRVAGNDVGVAVALKYMNESGAAFGPLARFFKVPANRVLVLYDDLDLPLGTIRVRAGGGSGGNRGAASMIRVLGTQEFPRVRIGIGRPPPGWDPADYVLSRFNPDEEPLAHAAMATAADAALTVLRDGAAAAMNQFN